VTAPRKGTALVVLWADVAPGQRPMLEAWAASEPMPPVGHGLGVLAAARYVAVSGGPAFLELHELRSDEEAVVESSHRALEGTLAALAHLGATVLPGGGPAGAERAPDREAPGVYAQIFPPGLDERLAVHGPAPVLQIGRIDIPPAQEDEFNEWYNTEYLIGYLRVPGVYSARRYVNRRAGPRYLTVYELAHAEVSRQPDWDRVRAQSVWRRRIERFWTHAPGSPGIYRRAAAR
jgi:hypothetical protein